MKKHGNTKGDDNCNGNCTQTPFEKESEDSGQRRPVGLAGHDDGGLISGVEDAGKGEFPQVNYLTLGTFSCLKVADAYLSIARAIHSILS